MTARNDGGYADLHVHTTFSDGMFTPEEAVIMAKKAGLKALAITDHDTVDGIQPAIAAAAAAGIEIIPGIELSASVGGSEIHLLGYFVDHNNEALKNRIADMRLGRVSRMKKMIGRLHGAGLQITEGDIFSTAGYGTVGRLHLATIMKAKGVVRTTKEAFEKYIGDRCPCYVKHTPFDHRDAIKMLLDAGGVPVLGHPGVTNADLLLPELIEAGLRGIEVYHSEHSPSATRKYLKMAEDNGLVSTGGSDCHGLKKDRILMGTVRVGKEVIEKLKKVSEAIKKGRHAG
jgi:predicted metal-dependent phosphoesterase TrpH